MKALVTGGVGFIGSHIVEALLERNCEVVVLDNFEPRVHGANVSAVVPRGAQLIAGDVRDKSIWEQSLSGVDVVFHQAAYQDYMLDFSRFQMVNAVGTALLYEVIVEKKLPIRKVIVASSQAVYGEGQYDCPRHRLLLPLSRSPEQLRRGDWELQCPHCGAQLAPRLLEEDHPNPSNQYAVSKFSGERLALGLGRIHQIPSVALRYSITQGPRQSLSNQYSGILRIFAQSARTGQPLIVYEDGRQTRDFVHIRDVVDANMAVLDSDAADYQAYNVGSGQPISVRQYADAVVAKLGTDIPVLIPGQYRVGDNRHSVSSIKKLKALGWSPRRSLSDILDDFFAWFRQTDSSNVPNAYRDMLKNGVVQSTTAGK